jgi:glycosyltransferase involved in cell wall biosynthesis
VKLATILYAYYNNPNMLRRQLHEWIKYDPALLDRTDFIVVDDGSMEAPALDVIASERHLIGALDLQVFRVMIDRPWGQDAARNVGMRNAQTQWVLMTDIDHVLTHRQYPVMMEFINRKAVRGNYYMPMRRKVLRNEQIVPYHPHPNSYLFHRDDFWEMGGYDEDFVGFYGSDGNFRKCAKGYGLQEKIVDSFSLLMFGTDSIPDANTRTLTRKEGELWAAKNPVLNKKRMGPAYRAIDPLRAPYSKVY